jgi:16S rRNA C1402 N4-methylase RsmH
MVKQRFKTLSDTDDFHLINKKVIKPHRKEREKNKASNSAKLRIIEKH